VAEKEFYSFEEALKELRLKEEELKRLVSEGEIRAFREGETMKLRKADVESLRKELSGGEVVELGGTSEEFVFEDDTELDAGMKTEEISEADTLIEEDVDAVEEVAAQEEVSESAEETERAPVVEEEEEPVAVAAIADEGVPEGMFVRAVVLITTLVLLLTTPVIASLASGSHTSLAVGIARLFGAME
jgi:excisionase family DNA binding protein